MVCIDYLEHNNYICDMEPTQTRERILCSLLLSDAGTAKVASRVRATSF